MDIIENLFTYEEWETIGDWDMIFFSCTFLESIPGFQKGTRVESICVSFSNSLMVVRVDGCETEMRMRLQIERV